MPQSLNALYPTALRPLIALDDPDGNPIVRAQTTKGDFAVFDRADFDKLMKDGASPNFYSCFDKGTRFYVRTSMRGADGRPRVPMVSRLIACPHLRGVRVRHKDGDRLNFRRANLYFDEGRTNATAWEARALKDPWDA